MTTSGMTHSWGSVPSNPVDSPEQQPAIYDRYGSFVAASLMGVLNNICPWTDVMLSNTTPKLIGMRELAECEGAESAKTGKYDDTISSLTYSLMPATTHRQESPHDPPTGTVAPAADTPTSGPLVTSTTQNRTESTVPPVTPPV
jgi:hypothetical protein